MQVPCLWPSNTSYKATSILVQQKAHLCPWCEFETTQKQVQSFSFFQFWAWNLSSCWATIYCGSGEKIWGVLCKEVILHKVFSSLKQTSIVTNVILMRPTALVCDRHACLSEQLWKQAYDYREVSWCNPVALSPSVTTCYWLLFSCWPWSLSAVIWLLCASSL